jgi:hypothetical protein
VLQDYRTTVLQDYITTGLKDYRTTGLQCYKTTQLRATVLQDYRTRTVLTGVISQLKLSQFVSLLSSRLISKVKTSSPSPCRVSNNGHPFHHLVQTCPVAHPASCPMGNGGKAAGAWSCSSTPLIYQQGVVLSLPCFSFYLSTHTHTHRNLECIQYLLI